MKRKVISIVLTAALVAGALAGCGESGQGNASQKSDSGKDLVVLRDAVMTGQLDQYATEDRTDGWNF